jgi:hypothetical protein
MRFVPSVIIICILLFCSIGTSGKEQPWTGFGIESNVMMGRMIRHTPKFTGPISSHVYGVTLNLIKQTYGQRDWHTRRRFPAVGAGFIYLNYNNPQVYGAIFGAYPMIQIPLLHTGPFSWSFKAGMGVCYATRPYERLPRTNTTNVAIGGHWNNVSPFSTDIRWQVDQHWEVQAGVNFTHVSNAAFQQPNLGINTFGLHLGARYSPVSNTPVFSEKKPEKLPGRFLLQARGSVGFVEASTPDGPLCPVYMGALFVSKRYWSKNKVYAGVDYYNNRSKYAYLKSKDHFPGEEEKHCRQAAVFAGNEFLVGRVGLMFQLGYYVRQMAEQNERLYQKLGGNIYFIQKEKGPLKELFFSAILKTHMGTAELFEMGLGIGI